MRPKHLPNFQAPPLNEVILGVQFSPPRNYQQILAGEVRSLFRAEYPQVQEQPALPPSFETFGLPVSSSQLQLIGGASHDRFWFLSSEGDELIQFQQDRLLHNWRKVGGGTNEYPRFERMVERFKAELLKLETYAGTLAPQTLQITQCEITYINHIGAGPRDALVVGDWLRFLAFQAPMRADDFAMTFREIISDDTGRPYGRLIVEAAMGSKEDGSALVALTITVRGAPKEPTIGAVVDFLSKGRELVVLRFAQMTTDAAHKHWMRLP